MKTGGINKFKETHLKNESDRHSNDGMPFYCAHCGAGIAEYMACESSQCFLEPVATAEARRQRWLDGMAKARTQASPRATVPQRATALHLENELRIEIKSIPHSQQRYDTCGDYYYVDNDVTAAPTLKVFVSELSSRREMVLVAIHELIEWALCESEGITNLDIDRFDLNYEKDYPTGPDEPGDCQAAPYYHQHQIATGIERILAAEMDVDWTLYEQHIEELSNGL